MPKTVPEPEPAAPVVNHASQMAAMLEDRSFADLTFEVDGIQFTAHKAILVSRSSYFRGLLLKDEGVGSGGPIHVENTSPAAFRAILRYLYTDELIFDEAEMLQVMRKAREMNLARVSDYTKNYVEAKLKGVLGVENVVQWFVQADDFGLADVREVALDYLAKHFREVRQEARGSLRVLEGRNKLMMEVMLKVV